MNLEWLGAVPPVTGTVLHGLAWLGLLVWVGRRPTEEIFAGAPDRAWWRDLRLWILPLAAVQIALYAMF